MVVIPTVTSLPEYIKALREMIFLPHTHKALYRGQADEWPLLPTLFRKHKVGFVGDIERQLLDTFVEDIPESVPSRPTNDWDWLSFGQHFGLPTRLLDWSANSLTALFFAVENNPKSPIVHVYHAQKSQIILSQAQDKKTSPFEIEKTRIMRPSPHSIRATLQEAWHTVHRIHPRRKGELFVPLADMKFHRGRIKSIRIDPVSAPQIQNNLTNIGITRAAVYGEFESVCATIKSKFGLK